MTFATARPLTAADQELLDLAQRTIDANSDTTSLDEDGLHTVGAAVRERDGRLFAGVNLYHFTGGPCGELVALGAARAQGGREFEAIVAVGRFERGVLSPCGRCRQVLADYHPRCRVIVEGDDGPVTVEIGDLLPGGYRSPEAVSE